MYVIYAGLLVVVFALLWRALQPRRQPGEPFDWTHRRKWWRPRWVFPDDR